MDRLGISRDEQRAMARKAKRGLLPPQVCVKCGRDLSDPDVPYRYRYFAREYGLALEVKVNSDTNAWRCPFCRHVWLHHPS